MEFPMGNLTFEVSEMEPKNKLRELIIYIADISQLDKNFGKTKLVKLLYMSDFGSFREYGTPITGHKYVKLPNGPFPDGLEHLLLEMRKANEIDIQEVPYSINLNPQQRVVPKRRANLTLFSAQDIANVDGIVREYWNHTGSEMADLTHGIAWKVADLGELIPYESSLVLDEPPTQEDIDIIDDLVAKYGVNPQI